MLGSKAQVATIDNRSIEINIPAGTQPDTLLSCKGEGLPNISTKIRGNLQIRIKADIPKYNEEQRNKLRNIKHGI
jgi:molecular chaperone DnaJ